MAAGRRLGVAGRLAVAQAIVAVAVAGITFAVAWTGTDASIRDRAEATALTLAKSLAVDPAVVEGVQEADPTATLQPYTERIRAETGIGFITIMSPERIRYTHPDVSRIGGRFVGDVAPALAGRAFTEEYTGTLGPSVRAVAPVTLGGRIVALVAVGVLTQSVSRALLAELPVLLGLPAAVLVLGLVVTLLIARYLGKVTGDRHPADLARMLDSEDVILHGLDEGLALLDRDGRLLHANDRAALLLGIVDGRLPDDVRPALTEGAGDAVLLVDGRVLLVGRRPAQGGRAVVVVRDATEVRRLAGELETMRTLSAALRAQSHEHANRLHTIVSLIELGRADDAAELAVATTRAGQRLTDALMEQVKDVVLVALLIGKASEAEERGIELEVHGEGLTDDDELDADLRADLVSIVGNLVDNAFDAVQSTPSPRRVTVDVRRRDSGLAIAVEDSGAGVPADAMEQVFRRGYSTKPHDGFGRGIGLALVRAAAARHGGSVALEQAEPHGARFVVSLPQVPA